MKFILFASIAFIVVHLSSAQDQAQVPPDAQDLHSKYLNADKTILKPVENLKQNYINHLQQLLKKNQQSGNLEAALEIKTEIDSSLEGKINEKAPAYQNLLKAKNLYSQAREANLRKLASERIRVLDIYRSQLEKQTKSLTKSGKLKEAKEVSEFSASLIEKRNELEQVNAFAQVDPKGNIDWASIVADIKAKKTKKTEVAANAKESNYEVMSEEDNPGLLVGFRLGMSKMRDSSGKEHRMVRGFQPIFRNSTGKETTSDSNIGFKNPISYKRIVAKPRYAVGAIEVQKDPHVRKLKVVFYRINGRRLSVEDSYESEWFGEWDATTSFERADTKGHLPAGVFGRDGLGINSIGLILLDSL